MNKDTIYKLLNSPAREDVLIGLSFLKEETMESVKYKFDCTEHYKFIRLSTPNYDGGVEPIKLNNYLTAWIGHHNIEFARAGLFGEDRYKVIEI